MAAVVRVSYFQTAPGTTETGSAEGGIKFNKDATMLGTTNAIPRPTATGTNYSWTKPLALWVASTDSAITISNRRIHYASAPVQAGLYMWYRADTSYAAPGPVTDNATTNGITPSGFTSFTTTATLYDATATAATASTKNGSWVSVILGVGFNYDASGAGTAIPTPNIIFTWDES